MNRLGAEMDDCIELWDMLLCQLADTQTEFLVSLTDAMLVRIIYQSSIGLDLDPYREALTFWLSHIYTSDTWSRSILRSNVNVNVAMATCLQNPNRWALQFGWAIIDSSFHKSARTRYEGRLREASEAYEKRNIHGIQVQSPTDAWHEWEGHWAPIPIGVVPSI